MPEIDVNGKKVEVDEDGFLVSLDQWDEDVAKYLAETEGLSELSEDHWKLINYLKDYYNEYGIAPMVRKMTKESGFSLKEIYDLFPSGPAKGACKIAGASKTNRLRIIIYVQFGNSAHRATDVPFFARKNRKTVM